MVIALAASCTMLTMPLRAPSCHFSSKWTTILLQRVLLLLLFCVFCFVFYIHRSGVLTALFGCYMAGATWNCSRFGAHSLYAIQPCTSLQCHFIRSHIRRVHECLSANCHLRLWQNDLDRLPATAVTRGWNGYRFKSQHGKLTLEEKQIIRPLLPDSNPGPFDPESGGLTAELFPLPRRVSYLCLMKG